MCVQVVGADSTLSTRMDAVVAMMKSHILMIRHTPPYTTAHIIIYLEANLSYLTADQCATVLSDPMFHPIHFESHDPKGFGRVGIITTQERKELGVAHVQRSLVANTLCYADPFISLNGTKVKAELEQQMRRYRMEKRIKDDIFQKPKFTMTGKGSGERDDMIMCLMLALYWSYKRRTDHHTVEAAHARGLAL